MPYNFLFKYERKKKGMTLRDAAASAGMNPATLYRYEEGIICQIPEPVRKRLMRLYGIGSEGRTVFDRAAQRGRLDLYESELKHSSPQQLLERIDRLDLRGRRTIGTLLRMEEQRLRTQKKPK